MIFFIYMYVKMPMIISAKYYQKNKENIHKKTREKYQNLS